MSNLVFQEEVKEVSDLFYLFSESRKRSPERSKSYFCPKCEVKEVLDLFSPHFGVTAEVRGKRGVFFPLKPSKKNDNLTVLKNCSNRQKTTFCLKIDAFRRKELKTDPKTMIPDVLLKRLYPGMVRIAFGCLETFVERAHHFGFTIAAIAIVRF